MARSLEQPFHDARRVVTIGDVIAQRRKTIWFAASATGAFEGFATYCFTASGYVALQAAPSSKKPTPIAQDFDSSKPVMVTFVLPGALCLARLRLLTAVGARGNRAGEGHCKQRDDRDSQNKDDHDNSLLLTWHACDQRSPFVFKRFGGSQSSAMGTKIDKCRRKTTFFHATVLW